MGVSQPIETGYFYVSAFIINNKLKNQCPVIDNNIF